MSATRCSPALLPSPRASPTLPRRASDQCANHPGSGSKRIPTFPYSCCVSSHWWFLRSLLWWVDLNHLIIEFVNVKDKLFLIFFIIISLWIGEKPCIRSTFFDLTRKRKKGHLFLKALLFYRILQLNSAAFKTCKCVGDKAVVCKNRGWNDSHFIVNETLSCGHGWMFVLWFDLKHLCVIYFKWHVAKKGASWIQTLCL